MFGNEFHGLSDEAFSYSDINVNIPIYGFTESYNLSVSAALCLYPAVMKLKSQNIDSGLKGTDKLKLRLNWYRNSVQNAEILEKEFDKRYVAD
jgi:tRNA (guanosine-2'-O-)-methyltransferase